MAQINWILPTGVGDWSDTANWSGATVPISTDDVTINQGNADIQTNLNQSAVTLASLTIGPGFSGSIGSTATPFPAPVANRREWKSHQRQRIEQHRNRRWSNHADHHGNQHGAASIDGGRAGIIPPSRFWGRDDACHDRRE